jgi:hypothetical protein
MNGIALHRRSFTSLDPQPCWLLRDFYVQASGVSVTLPAAGYDYSSDWPLLLAGLSPAGMAASLAAPEVYPQRRSRASWTTASGCRRGKRMHRQRAGRRATRSDDPANGLRHGRAARRRGLWPVPEVHRLGFRAAERTGPGELCRWRRSDRTPPRCCSRRRGWAVSSRWDQSFVQ